MKNNHLITIVVPVFNVEKYLQRCLNSIINQSYSKLEIILVDDGSTDNSGIICDSYAKKDDRIKVIHKTNCGLSEARNTGILNATGDYIAFIDSDDYISRNFVYKMYNFLIENDADVISCDMKRFYNPIKEDEKLSTIEIFDNYGAIKCSLYERKIDNSVCNKIFNIHLFDKIKFPNGKYFEDLATTYKIFLKCKKILYLNENLYFYFQNPSSIMSTTNEKKIDDLYDISVNMQNELSKYDELKKPLNARIINIYFYICRESCDNKKKEDCFYKIKKMRKEVFMDKDISFKTRFGIISSYLGIGFVNWIFKIYRKVKV